MTAAPDPVVRVRAELRHVHDGDTYVMLLDLRGNGFDAGAETFRVRLRDYSSPELGAPAAPPLLSGHAARDYADKLLRAAGSLTVELLGPDPASGAQAAAAESFARQVAWVWADDVALGPALAAAGAARAGAFKG